MGILGLMSYMEKHPDIYYKINILDEVNNSQKGSLIVVDGSASLNKLYGNCYMDKLANGQYQQFYKNIIKFGEYFKNINVKLVVFFDGSVIPKKRDVWVKRRMRDYENTREILDALKENKEIRNVRDIPIPIALHSVAKTAFSEFCDVHISSAQECDIEILAYAKKNNVLAILSQDSDFAMSTGNWCFWSIKDIDLDKNIAYVYDKKALARHFHLPENLLPLMATLSGNDFISLDLLENWHKNLIRRRYVNRHDLFPKIAMFVRKFNSSTLNNYDLDLISDIVFKSNRYKSLIQETVSSYLGTSSVKYTQSKQYDDNWKIILKKIDDLRNLEKIDVNLINIFRYQIFNLSTTFDDPREEDLPMSGLFWRSLRAKVYGICLANYPDKDIKIEEWVSAGPGSLDKATYVQPEFHCNSNINILNLITEEVSEEYRNLGWSLMLNAIDNILYLDDLHKLPNYIKPSFITLVYMMHKSLIEIKELRFFLQVCIMCSFCNNAIALINKNNVIINPKALRLASIYLRGIHTFKMLLQCCGFLIENKYFGLEKNYDGILFHFLYNGGIIEEYDNHPDLLQCVNLIKKNMTQIE